MRLSLGELTSDGDIRQRVGSRLLTRYSKLGSKNGTFARGAPVGTPVRLVGGDETGEYVKVLMSRAAPSDR